MSELKCERSMIYLVQHSDLEHFIKEEYGHVHEIACAEEANNMTTLPFRGIGSPGQEDELESETFKEWCETGKFWPWGTRTILENLCFSGKIEPGDYYVQFYW